MRTRLILSLAVCLALAAAGGARADEVVNAILDKAIKAHGGADKLAREGAARTRSKGTIEILGGLSFTEESLVQDPDKLKSTLQLEVMGQNVTVVTAFSKDKGWYQANGQTMDMDAKMLDAMKEALYLIRVAKLTALRDNKDKALEVSILGEDKVDGRPVIGIRVASKGHNDISLFFDKETGLVSKLVHRSPDPMSGQEITEERIIQEYQDLDGLKVAKKALINHDGKKFMEVEVLEVKLVDKVDDSEFAKP